MKYSFTRFLAIWVILASIASCNSTGSDSGNRLDTPVKTSADTTVIPGTPGPSGTEPGPGDTSRAKRAASTADSSAAPRGRP